MAIEAAGAIAPPSPIPFTPYSVNDVGVSVWATLISGISAEPGLYCLGLQWLSKMNSSFLSGVGDDAAVLADHILGRR